jgi:membrane fusion protein (multidrug efflux system)
MSKAMNTMKLTLLLLSGYFVISCGNSNGQKQAGPPQGPRSFPVVSIPVRTVTSNLSYPASIEGIVNSEVRAKIAGYITDVLIDEGQKVRKGETLFRLETQSLNQDAAAAKANVHVAQVEVDKLKPLVEKGIISKVRLQTALAELQQAQSSYNSIGANIDYANIKSPINGFVGTVRLRKGALVSPANQQPLTLVSDISKVYAYFSMNEKEYLNFIENTEGKDIPEKINNLPKVRLLLANGRLYEQEGIIETINSQVDANTGTISFRAVFDNPSRLLTNGNSGKIQVPKVYTDALVVPKESTYEQQGSTYVFKVGKDSMAIASRIGILDEVDNLYIISEGIEKGDQIIAEGATKLRGETKVKPMEVPFDSVAKPIKKMFR